MGFLARADVHPRAFDVLGSGCHGPQDSPAVHAQVRYRFPMRAPHSLAFSYQVGLHFLQHRCQFRWIHLSQRLQYAVEPVP